MIDLLRDYELKRGHLQNLLESLRVSVAEVTSGQPKPVPGAFDVGQSSYVFRLDLPAVKPEWSLLVGDAVSNARAALNYLITALVRSTGAEEDHNNEFPIYGIERQHWTQVEKWWEADSSKQIKRRLANTPPDTKEVMKSLQPFVGVPRVDPRKHPLFQLQAMSNRDKHRRLNVLARVMNFQFVDKTGRGLFPGPEHRARVTEAHDGDRYTITLGLSKKRPDEIYVRPRYEVSVHEPPDVLGDVTSTLDGIANYLDNRVLPAIRTLLRGNSVGRTGVN